MANIREQINDSVAIEHEQLTDGSVAYNVIAELDYDDPYARSIQIGCTDREQAHQIAEALRVVVFIKLIA
ncbi:MAG: hypothetical protein WC455_18005, partial [Dehalococcoidia bacterium]|jgi:phage replication-related protein YjqB (UPF0714/DUF867 family)